MSIYTDISYEKGIRYRDITLYCDRCLLEDFTTTNAIQSRRIAKKAGWLRKWSKKERRFVDICPNCKS